MLAAGVVELLPHPVTNSDSHQALTAPLGSPAFGAGRQIRAAVETLTSITNGLADLVLL